MQKSDEYDIRERELISIRRAEAGRTVMQEFGRIAAAIDLRVRQLETQGIKGAAIVDHMFGYMPDLQRIYDTASDAVLADLCQHYPGFYRYAGLMEAMSEKNHEMMAAGTHPYGNVPELPVPLKRSLEKLMGSAAELERGFQTALDSGRFAAHATRLTALKRQWGSDLESFVHTFRASGASLQAQAVVQQVIKGMAERIDRLGRG